jgi:hypothetical protein
MGCRLETYVHLLRAEEEERHPPFQVIQSDPPVSSAREVGRHITERMAQWLIFYHRLLFWAKAVSTERTSDSI